MKFIHTADWHIGRSLFDYSLIEDQSYFLEQFIEIAAEEKPDAIIIAGDLYNRAVPGAQAVELLDRALSRLVLDCAIPIVAIAGNHDSAERLSFCSGLLGRAGLYIAGQAESPLRTFTLEKGKERVCFTLLPHFTPAEARALLDDTQISTCNDAFQALMERHLPTLPPDVFQILVAHGFFSNLSGHAGEEAVFSRSELSIGSLDIVDISSAEAFDYIALGHLHAPQRAGLPHARYAGSPLKYSLSESRQRKSVTIVETDGPGRLALRERALPALRDVRILTGPFDALMDPQNQQGENLLDYVYANIEGSDAVLHAMSKLRRVFPNILGLTFVSRESGSQPFARLPVESAHDTVEALFAQFYQQVMSEPLDPARLALVHQFAREVQP